jgi:hypothetical protein
MPRQGEIYLHTQYKYPLGNIEDKYIIILNKPSPPNPSVLVVPATKYADTKTFLSGCYKGRYEFRLLEKEDFFPLKTVLQIYILNAPDSISDEVEFNKLLADGTIQLKGALQQKTIQALLDCIKYHKTDIDLKVLALL